MLRPFPLILSLVLCAPALAQGPTPPPLSVSTGSANVPKNANPADIQDLRVLTKASEDPYEYERRARAGRDPRPPPRLFLRSAQGLGSVRLGGEGARPFPRRAARSRAPRKARLRLGERRALVRRDRRGARRGALARREARPPGLPR